MRNLTFILVASSLMFPAKRSPATEHQRAVPAELVYVGTGTSGSSRGIYAYRFDPATGRASFLGLEAATPNPTFLAVARDRRTLYAVNELGKAAGIEGNTVSAFRIDAHSGRLRFINRVSSEGIGPCDLALAHKARFLLVSNCGSGSVALLPILPGGSLAQAASVVQHHGSSVNPLRQSGPHAHGIAISLDDRFALVADLGIDKILVHPIEPQKPSLSAPTQAVLVTRGGGVRHLALDPNGHFLYSIDELDSALAVFRYARGRIEKAQTEYALPAGAPPQRGGSELAFDPSGRFLYVSVRGAQNNIAVFSIDPQSGVPYPLQFVSSEGIMPRHFALDLSGIWLAVANQKSHSIVWLRRDPVTGRLRSTGDSSGQLDSPMCVAFVPAS
ncbi:MAG TPA: lactonase family protein [Terracidiphilus sp.]|nr:lactonase family protein [Terracidiphilus sp.]